MDPHSQSLNTNELLFWVLELQNGRPDAAEPTFRRIITRIETLARAMFKKFPRVGRFVDLDDVVQNSVIRLLNAFRKVRPVSTRHFYALTNELIRRELLDLTRHFYGPRGHGTNLASTPVGDAEGECSAMVDDADTAELERFAAFHTEMEQLPVEQREVFGLAYYHGWSKIQIADLFGVSTRTVLRWQEAASATLKRRCGMG